VVKVNRPTDRSVSQSNYSACLPGLNEIMAYD
jgi:hypothetical protein